MYRAREQTPEDGLRRLSVREEPHRGQQRNSYSGPASDYYRERQERDDCAVLVRHFSALAANRPKSGFLSSLSQKLRGSKKDK